VGRIVDEGQDDVDVMQSLLPTAFGGSAKAATAAWHGDKLLNAAIAKELEVQAPHCDVGQLTRWASKAASNQVMATHISELLPSKLMKLLPTAAQERQVCESRTNPTQYTQAPSNASKRIYAIKPSSKPLTTSRPISKPIPSHPNLTNSIGNMSREDEDIFPFAISTLILDEFNDSDDAAISSLTRRCRQWKRHTPTHHRLRPTNLACCPRTNS